MDISKRIFSVLVFMLGVHLTPSQAQMAPPPPVQASYSVINGTDVALVFQTLNPMTNGWTDHKLAARATIKLTKANPNTQSKIRIETPTHGYVEYNVGAGGIYRLTWSEAKQKWDLLADLQSDAKRAMTNPVAPPVANVNPSGPPPKFRVGQAVIVLWKNNKWYEAGVVQVANGQLKVTYVGYDSSYDDWVQVSNVRAR